MVLESIYLGSYNHTSSTHRKMNIFQQNNLS